MNILDGLFHVPDFGIGNGVTTKIEVASAAQATSKLSLVPLKNIRPVRHCQLSAHRAWLPVRNCSASSASVP
jgi:hypothetical protein